MADVLLFAPKQQVTGGFCRKVWAGKIQKQVWNSICGEFNKINEMVVAPNTEAETLNSNDQHNCEHFTDNTNEPRGQEKKEVFAATTLQNTKLGMTESQRDMRLSHA